MTITILTGCCLSILSTLPDQSVHTCVTSPPYFGLRDYGVPRQIGLEPTPDQFVDVMLRVFREIRRVLRDDGTLWLNLGDSYATNPGNGRGRDERAGLANGGATPHRSGSDKSRCGLKPKDLLGIPWRVAFALQADGWYLRSDIIWSKPNPMPESVTDRPTKAHEYLFLLSKSERYAYDAEAIKEPCTQEEHANGFRGGAYCNNSTFNNAEGGKRVRSGNIKRKIGTDRDCPQNTGSNVCSSIPWEGTTRNKRSVWTVGTKPFPEAHFATYPPELIEPCILAGSPVGGTVLDPFFGAGTTGLVADRHGRHCVGIELNPDYVQIAEKRLRRDAGMFADIVVAA
jgi:DNA modification methylase